LRKIACSIFLITFLFIFTGSCLGDTGGKIVLNIPALTLEYYEGETLIKAYPVAAGRKVTQTPRGDFKVISKIKNPTWSPRGKAQVPPGPTNPLGTRWIGFKGGYGIHGNNKPSVIGTLASSGCVRMYNEDAEELYEKVTLGTPVEVIYETFVISKDGVKPYIKIFPDLYGLGINARETIIAKLKEQPIVLSEKKLSSLLNNVNKKPVIITEGYSMTFNGEFVTNDIIMNEQDLYINKQELEHFFKTAYTSTLPATIGEKQYIPIKDIFNHRGLNIKINDDEERIDVQGNVITVNGQIIQGGFLREHNRILLPVRPLSEFLGVNVFWDNDARTVFLNENPVKTALIKGQAYMPIEQICSLLGFNWTMENKKGFINMNSS
jgi:hypothetical protein